MPVPDQLSEGLARLDPQERALVELSAIKGLSDEEIAGVLRVEPEEVHRRREEALERLAVVLGLGTADIDELRERLAALRTEPAPAERELKEELGEEEPGERQPGRRWRPAILIGILAIVAVVALVVVVAGGGDDEEPESASTTAEKTPAAQPTETTATTPETVTETTPEPEPEPAPEPTEGPVRTMEVLNDTHGRGVARLVSKDGRSILRLRVADFLEPQGGGYAVWLFNSEEDARRLYASRETDYERDISLPDDFEKYEFVDVARAVPDLDSDHSGLSLLRVPIAALKHKG